MEQPEISNPSLWRLLLLIDGTAIRAVALSTVDDVQTLAFSVPFDPTASGGLLAAVEEAVYAVPLLTADFAAVDVLVDTPHYLVAPSEIGPEALEASARYCCLADEGETLLTDGAAGHDTAVVWPCPEDLSNFLARTFRNPRVSCRITPLLRYISAKNAGGNGAKLYAHLTGGVRAAVDILAFGRDGSLLLCTTKDSNGQKPERLSPMPPTGSWRPRARPVSIRRPTAYICAAILRLALPSPPNWPAMRPMCCHTSSPRPLSAAVTMPSRHPSH